jgi:NAD(P)-dependent dehydrogenase (short-subunit alcohol dehydrogenase family)
MTMTPWSKRTWLITGSSTGLGRATAEAVLEKGGRVVATARDPSVLADLVARGKGRVLTPRLDVADANQVVAAVAEAERAFGGIDVLVNNAGYGFLGGIEESSAAEIRAQFDVNFFGLVAVTQAVLPGMRRRKSGYVVNMSSIVGLCGMPAAGFYAASKFAVEGMSEGLAAEGGPLGIQVMVVEPGPFRTDFNGRSIRKPARVIADYENAVAVRNQSVSDDGLQPGDPVRAAHAMIRAMEQDVPPFRLPLGKLASDMAAGIHQARGAEVSAWRDLAIGADFPELTVA